MSAPNSVFQTDSLIPTKLYQPRNYAHMLPRPHLVQRLREGLACDVTLISAPAGYGKTTLLSIWLHDCQRAVAWISLDDADSEIASFLSYVAAALRRVEPKADMVMSRLLMAATMSARQVAELLLNDLVAIQTDLVLVLDDYHLIADDSPVHEIMRTVIDYVPPHVHLVIACRTDPPLPLARLRANRQLCELRAHDLQFSREEVQAYVQEILGTDVAQSVAEALHARTEGWPAGVQLAALSARRRTDQASFLMSFTGSSGFVMDYLADEVLARLPDKTQRFLLQVSIFDSYCPALCAAVTGLHREECQEILLWLATHNVFTLVIDAQNQLYRFHKLFQELLRFRLHTRMGTEHIAQLHRRASVWLVQQGRIEEALHHVLVTEDMDEAARLLEQHKHSLLNAERFHELEHLLHLLPDEIIGQRPALLLTRAFIYHFRGNILAKIVETMQAVEQSLAREEHHLDADTWHALTGEADSLYSLLWYWRGDSMRTIHHAQRAVALLPASHTYVRGLALFYMGAAYQLQGDLRLAVQKLQQALLDIGADEVSIQLRVHLSLCLVYFLAGELRPLAQAAQKMLKLAQLHDQPVSIGWAHWTLGIVHYEWNELATAAEHFAQGIALHHRVRIDTLAFCYLGQAQVYQAQNQPHQAEQSLDILLDILLQNHSAELVQLLESFRAHLALQQGELEQALSWVRSVDDAHLSYSDVRQLVDDIPLLTRARILIARGTPSSLAQAMDSLRACLTATRTAHNVRRIIEIRALQSLGYEAQGSSAAALDALTEAMTLAQRSNFVRTFVDLGAPMALLVRRLLERGALAQPVLGYAHAVLAAFPPETGHRMVPLSLSASAPLPIESLTDREMEVLQLLEQRLSNNEIARKLVISPRTVKKHTSNIYQKLHVSSRRQAVDKARSLAILSA